MRILLLSLSLTLVACTGADATNADTESPDTEVVDLAPAPPYTCPGDARTPCQFAPETCEQVLDCPAICAHLNEICDANEQCGPNQSLHTNFLCGWGDLTPESCHASCRGSVTSSCFQRTQWDCGGRYDTCGDIDTCVVAGTGE
jgi:hypothetical protein